MRVFVDVQTEDKIYTPKKNRLCYFWRRENRGERFIWLCDQSAALLKCVPNQLSFAANLFRLFGNLFLFVEFSDGMTFHLKSMHINDFFLAYSPLLFSNLNDTHHNRHHQIQQKILVCIAYTQLNKGDWKRIVDFIMTKFCASVKSQLWVYVCIFSHFVYVRMNEDSKHWNEERVKHS